MGEGGGGGGGWGCAWGALLSTAMDVKMKMGLEVRTRHDLITNNTSILTLLLALALLFWRCVIPHLPLCRCDVSGMDDLYIPIRKVDSVRIIRVNLSNMTTVTTSSTLCSTIYGNHNLLKGKHWKCRGGSCSCSCLTTPCSTALARKMCGSVCVMCVQRCMCAWYSLHMCTLYAHSLHMYRWCAVPCCRHLRTNSHHNCTCI